MPLMLLGLVFVIGLFAFYLFSTGRNSKNEEDYTETDDELKKEENVIFLPDDLESIKEKHRRKK